MDNGKMTDRPAPGYRPGRGAKPNFQTSRYTSPYGWQLEHQSDHPSQWASIANSIASKIGCTGETLRKWVRQAERDQGFRDGTTTEERDRLKALERENRELRQANEILRKASAYFAQAELDRPFKR